MTNSRPRGRATPDEKVSFRLDAALYTMLSDAAEMAGVKLSTYIRERLEADQQYVASMNSFITTLHDIEKRLEALEDQGAGDIRSTSGSLEVESVMLMRQLLIANNRKKDIDLVHGEMKRLGFSPFKSGTREGGQG